MNLVIHSKHIGSDMINMPNRLGAISADSIFYDSFFTNCKLPAGAARDFTKYPCLKSIQKAAPGITFVENSYCLRNEDEQLEVFTEIMPDEGQKIANSAVTELRKTAQNTCNRVCDKICARQA